MGSLVDRGIFLSFHRFLASCISALKLDDDLKALLPSRRHFVLGLWCSSPLSQCGSLSMHHSRSPVSFLGLFYRVGEVWTVLPTDQPPAPTAPLPGLPGAGQAVPGVPSCSICRTLPAAVSPQLFFSSGISLWFVSIIFLFPIFQFPGTL